MNIKNGYQDKKKLRLLLLVFLTTVYSFKAFAFKEDMQTALNTRISVEFKNVSLKEAITQLGLRLPNVSFTYIENNALNTSKVSLLVKNEKMNDVLTKILSPFCFSYTVLQDHIIIRFDEEKAAKQRSSSMPGLTDVGGKGNIKGMVANAQMAPVAGVAIMVKNKGKCGVANRQGRFNLHYISDSAVLIFSKPGYVSRQVSVLNAADGFLIVQLAQDIRKKNAAVNRDKSIKN